MTSDSSGELGREDHWIPLADLMTGLMLVFMLLAISFMYKIHEDTRRAAVIYDQMRNSLYRDLFNEFKRDLPLWGATLDKNLTIRFDSPRIMFDAGRSDLKPKFKFILTDFFPRYLRILSNPKYQSSIEEIRIEGNSSSVWSAAETSDDAYFKNMQLSQDRALSTLNYVLKLSEVSDDADWLKSHVTAVGLSSSKPVKSNGVENASASQRVEFRVRTNADDRLKEIFEMFRR